MTVAKLIVQQIPIDEITIGDHRRPIDEAAVEALAQSIQEIGLLTPITVRREDAFTEDGKDDGETWTLIAGRHRLEAFRKLGRENIDVIFKDTNDIDAELHEIAENLYRADLSTEQKYIYLRRYAELKAERDATQSISTQKATKIGRGRPKGIVSEVAKETNQSKDTVRRALAAPKPKIVRVAEEPLTDEEVAKQQHAALTALWNKTGELARQWFREDLDRPVMDTRFGTNPHTGTFEGEGIPAFIRRQA